MLEQQHPRMKRGVVEHDTRLSSQRSICMLSKRVMISNTGQHRVIPWPSALQNFSALARHAGLAAARPLMMAAYGHKIPVHLVVSVASHFAVTTLLLCLRELFPAFFHDWLQELHSVMRMYVFAQAAFAAKATAASLPHLNTPFRFLLHVCFASHTTSMGIAAVTHPLRLVPNIATHAGMLVMSSGARTAACTASLTSGGALLYLQRLAQALGIPASDAVRSCPLVMYRLQMACSMALVVGGLVAEFMLRRAFLYSRWRCLGANGKQKALTWPFGDPRGVFWFIALVCGALGCCAFVWLTFV